MLTFTCVQSHLHQHCKPAGLDAMKTFLQKILVKTEGESIVKSVEFSDEATFHLNGLVNRNNCITLGSK